MAGKTIPRRARDLSALSSLSLPVALNDEGRGYAAYPNLSKARWLFPENHPRLRRSALRKFFKPRTFKGKIFRTVVANGGLPGERVCLEEEGLGRLETELSRALGSPEVGVAFYVGTPGAYRKATAQALTPRGETLAFAKIAASPEIRADVEAERANLSLLSTQESLDGAVPRVLGCFPWQEAEVLLISDGPQGPGPDELSSEHLRFLVALFLAFDKEVRFAESPMFRRVSEKVDRLSPDLPGDLTDTLSRAMDNLVEGIGEVSVPVSMAHRDFAPWNTRVGERGLFVFDWDHAEDGVVPLYDAFHFQAIKAALFGRGPLIPDARFSSALLDSVWPDGHGHVPHLYLAYLLDISLMYAGARLTAPDAGESGVWNWFNARIADFLRGDTPF